MFEATIAVSESRRTAPLPDKQCVFVVDYDPAVRESLDASLASAGWEVWTFASASDFLSHPRRPVPSCLVFDMASTGHDGSDVQRRVGLPVVLIAAHVDVPTGVRAMKAGAVDLLLKPLDQEALLGAVEHALAVSAAALRREQELIALQQCHASLTPREAQVMALVVAGRLNKQVAGELAISEITVKAHRGKLMRKMMARTLPDLVRMAGRLGIA